MRGAVNSSIYTLNTSWRLCNVYALAVDVQEACYSSRSPPDIPRSCPGTPRWLSIIRYYQRTHIVYSILSDGFVARHVAALVHSNAPSLTHALLLLSPCAAPARGAAMDGEYDAIVLGTGLKECIISGLLSVKGWKARLGARVVCLAARTRHLATVTLNPAYASHHPRCCILIAIATMGASQRR